MTTAVNFHTLPDGIPAERQTRRQLDLLCVQNRLHPVLWTLVQRVFTGYLETVGVAAAYEQAAAAASAWGRQS